LAFWTARHELSAEREASVMIHHARNGGLGEIQGKLFGDQPARKRWLKSNVYAQSPLFWRALAYFSYRYFLRLGFLDGPEGLIFHFLQGGWYRFYVDAKIWEA